MSTPKKFCVMATLYKPSTTEGSKFRARRSSDVNGPFAETHEKAVEAFKLFLEKKGWSDVMLFNVFLAEKQEDRAKADCATSKFGYRIDLQKPETMRLLKAAGMRPA
jgi:hypothetical protein